VEVVATELCSLCEHPITDELSRATCPSCGHPQHSRCRRGALRTCPAPGCGKAYRGPKSYQQAPRWRNNLYIAGALLGLLALVYGSYDIYEGWTIQSSGTAAQTGIDGGIQIAIGVGCLFFAALVGGFCFFMINSVKRKLPGGFYAESQPKQHNLFDFLDVLFR
jgi:hypothetical protein